MSVDKQDLIDNEEELAADDRVPPPHSAYYDAENDGPAVISTDSAVSTPAEKRKSIAGRSTYTAYSQPSPFDFGSQQPSSNHIDLESPGSNNSTLSLTQRDELSNGIAQLAAEDQPKDYTIKAILVAIFCCLPIGIHAYSKAKEANQLHLTGHRDLALESAQKAHKWIRNGLIAGTMITLPLIVVLVVLLVLFL